ncbi:MAG: hypothetical protein V4560_16295 [Bacteroidota bacterium]
MKKLFVFIGCLFSLNAFAQEKLNTFHVVDSKTKKPVKAVSITIVRAKLSINTENDGVFIIPGNLIGMRDTVILYAQTYIQLKIALNKLDGIDTIQMNKFVSAPGVTQFNYKDDTLLNNFDQNNIGHYAGIHTRNAFFNYLQLAQQFDIKKVGIRLKTVTVQKLTFNYNPQKAKFKIRIYDIDSTTGGPGKDLCYDIIEVVSNESSKQNINLKNYNIIIPNKTFFVTIEWIRDNYNAGYAMIYDVNIRASVQHINYRPIIGISPITGDKLNIWALNFKHEWKPFTYFSPFGTDLAIKATVEY